MQIEDHDLELEDRLQHFQDLMPLRVQKILLVSSPYDSYLLEEDGQLDDVILNEFMELNLRHAPGMTRVASAADALSELGRNKYRAMAVTRKDLGLPLITYVALILATSSLAIGRRLRLLGIGLLILILSHAPTLAVLFLEFLSRLKRETGIADFYGSLADILNIFSEIFPFILWFVVVPIRLPGLSFGREDPPS